ncbi:MAG: hypothetical protein ACYCR2_07880 [Thermoplasmataceae archaeon]
MKGIGPNSKLAEELRYSSINLFNTIPERSSDRNRAKLYDRYRIKVSKQILSRADEIMDALTELVKDFPDESEIKKSGDLLKEVLKTTEGEDLMERIASLEGTLTQQEKNAVFRDELNKLKKTLESVMKELVKINWAEVTEADSEKLYALSETISTSNSIIDSLITQLSINSGADIKQGMSILLYLVLRANAYLLGKISSESLTSTISAIQSYAYTNATYLSTIAIDITIHLYTTL